MKDLVIACAFMALVSPFVAALVVAGVVVAAAGKVAQ